MNYKMGKGIIITSLAVLGIGTLGYFYTRRPKGSITINSDGSGTVSLGSKSADFEKDMGTEVRTWNGWTLSGSAKSMLLRHYGKTYEQGDISKFSGGSSNVEIIFK